jgi:hypothetical protein
MQIATAMLLCGGHCLDAETFEDVQGVLGRYCIDCHSGSDAESGIAIDSYTATNARSTDRANWRRILRQLQGRAMPPDDADQPSEEERKLVEQWILDDALKVECVGPDRPGRVTIRRLNRQEYDNTIRDLFGIDLKLAKTFPSDDVGYGFDNIGDVLSVSPVLFERYIDAADEIVRTVIASTDVEAAPRRQFEGKRFPTRGQVTRDFTLEDAGEYVLRVRAWGDQAGNQACFMLVGLDGKPLRKELVRNDRNRPTDFEVTLDLKQGKHQLGVAFLNDFYLKSGPQGKKLDRNLNVDSIELIGPLGILPDSLPEFHTRFFQPPIDPRATVTHQTEAIKKLLNPLASRAFRRRASITEVESLGRIFSLARRNGETVERSTQLAVAAILVSPSFLFRMEVDPEPGEVRDLNDFELATRLSYFLWSSMPDDELFGAAARGELHTEEQLVQQARRMLKDDRVEALVENFAGQWLQLRGLEEVSPSQKQFPTFDNQLREAMLRETELFFRTIVSDNRSILDFLDADYTYVNDRLAKHYGISGVSGPDFKRVSLEGGRRGGLLGQASILTVTSDPTRTSPVKRGKWILENLFDAPPPEPPPNVPQLAEGDSSQLTGSLREQMERHRADPACASCHKMMDPLGFGLENYNAIGAWRDRDGTIEIDATGELPSGQTFDGPQELRHLLLQRQDDFRRCLSEKMLTFALGRGLEYYDACAVERIVNRLQADDDRFAIVVEEIVKSPAFRQRESGESQ